MEVKVCQLSELEERKAFIVDFDGIEVGVIKVENQLYAYENICPHMGGPVCLGGLYEKVKLKINEDKTVEKEYVSEQDLNLVCPWHGLEFDLETGETIFQSNLKLKKYPVYIKDDHVYIDLK